jgi:hypothetical protein
MLWQVRYILAEMQQLCGIVVAGIVSVAAQAGCHTAAEITDTA